MIQDAIADLISKPVDQRKLSLRPPPEIWERSDKDFKIVESWRRFLRTMDRLYYRAIEVQNLLNNSSDGEEISCGMQRFFEIVSMAHTRLNAVYQAMEFGLGVYEREVKVPRERLGKPNSEEFDKWKKEFLSAVSYAYNKAFMNSAEFIEAITDPEYERLWLQSDPRPSKYQMAELVVRDTCSRVSDVAWLCSKILNTLGMEAPFTGFDDRQSSDTSISE
jgi:hypothetical protein